MPSINPRNTNIIWIIISVILLLIVQLFTHSFLYFVVASLVCGVFSWRNMSFFKFFLIELGVLALCFLIHGIDLPTARIMGQILPVGTWGYVLAVVLVSAISFALCAYTVYLFIGNIKIRTK